MSIEAVLTFPGFGFECAGDRDLPARDGFHRWEPRPVLRGAWYKFSLICTLKLEGEGGRKWACIGPKTRMAMADPSAVAAFFTMRRFRPVSEYVIRSRDLRPWARAQSKTSLDRLEVMRRHETAVRPMIRGMSCASGDVARRCLKWD